MSPKELAQLAHPGFWRMLCMSRCYISGRNFLQSPRLVVQKMIEGTTGTTPALDDPRIEAFLREFDLADAPSLPGPFMGLSSVDDVPWCPDDDGWKPVEFPLGDGFSLCWEWNPCTEWLILRESWEGSISLGWQDGNDWHGALRLPEFESCWRRVRDHPQGGAVAADAMLQLFACRVVPSDKTGQDRLHEIQRRAWERMGLVKADWEWPLLEFCNAIIDTAPGTWTKDSELGWVLEPEGRRHDRQHNFRTAKNARPDNYKGPRNRWSSGPRYFEWFREFNEVIER